MYDYLIYLKFNKTSEINQSFFSSINIDPQELFSSLNNLQFYYNSNTLEDLSPHQKAVCLDTMARVHSAALYNIKISSWHPSASIDLLINELQEHGPLGIGGSYGRPHYAVEPKFLKKINDRHIYCWKRSDPKISGLISAHMILLIGAEKRKDRDFVYYIDPTDESDPNSLQKQKVYVMSYETLTSENNIANLYGTISSAHSQNIGYAVFKG